MMNGILFAMLAVSLSFFEIGFVRSLGSAWALIPLVFTVYVYMIQHRGIRMIGWYLIFHGFLLDLMNIGTTSLDTFVYALGALVLVFSSRQVFSNRSFYGLIACALSGFLTIIFSESIILLFSSLKDEFFPWTVFLTQAIARSMFMVVFLSGLYLVAEKIRRKILNNVR